jgi:hypothetical protein
MNALEPVAVLVALVIALLLLFVFKVAWVANVVSIGGLAFFLLACFVIIFWLIGKARHQ